MLKELFSSLLPLALLAALASGAGATTLVALSDDELIDRADLIVTGRCIGIESQWRGRTLMTAATVEVTDVLKDEQGTLQSETITVWVPGGIDHQRRFPVAMTFPGAPSLATGEEVALFLTAGGESGDYFITGFSQGKFLILDGEHGEPVVRRDLGGGKLSGTGGPPPDPSQATPLGVFKSRIAEHLAGGTETPAGFQN